VRRAHRTATTVCFASLTIWGGFIYLVILRAGLFIVGALVETWLLLTGRLNGVGR